MEFDEAKNILTNIYINSGLEIIDKKPNEVYFKTNFYNRFIVLEESEINKYIEAEKLFNSIVNEPFETSILNSNYREQAISYNRAVTFRFLMREPFSFGKIDGQGFYIEISEASNLFLNYFKRNVNFMQNVFRRLPFNNEQTTTESLIRKPITIKIQNLNCTSLEEAIKVSASTFNMCMFELAYLKGVTFDIVEEWNRRNRRDKTFDYEKFIPGNNFPLTNNIYNEDIVKLYHRGVTTEDPVNRFISYYQVLEYYFVQVSDEQLYNKLSRKINDPKFTTNPSNLDKIIQETLEHKRETDEVEMLNLVLRKYISEDDLFRFIRTYESFINKNIYTKKHTYFGKELEVKLQTNHVFNNIAKRIKVFRNALVHSSDRYEREERYIPSKDSEEIIKKEVPLLKYLAEKVIIATATTRDIKYII